MEPKPARAFSLLQGNICLEPVPYLAGLSKWPESLMSRFYSVRELHFASARFQAAGGAEGKTSIDARRGMSTQIQPSWLEHIDRLQLLEILELTSHALEWLPSSVCELEELWLLMLRDNALTELPKCLGKLSKMTHFDASLNRLAALPAGLTSMPVRNLFVRGNSLDALPENLGRSRAARNSTGLPRRASSASWTQVGRPEPFRRRPE